MCRASICLNGCCAIPSMAVVPCSWFSPYPARSETLWAGGVNPTRVEQRGACWFSTPASWRQQGTSQTLGLMSPPVDGPFCRAFAAWQGGMLVDRLRMNLMAFFALYLGPGWWYHHCAAYYGGKFKYRLWCYQFQCYLEAVKWGSYSCIRIKSANVAFCLLDWVLDAQVVQLDDASWQVGKLFWIAGMVVLQVLLCYVRWPNCFSVSVQVR